MDASHLTLNGQIGLPSDMTNLPLNFDAMMASDNGLVNSLSPFGPCLHHDSSCSSNQSYRQYRFQDKPPVTSSLGLQQDSHSHLSAAIVRKSTQSRRGYGQRPGQAQQQRKPNPDSSCPTATPQSYDWHHLFTESSLQSSAVPSGNAAVCQDDDDCASECSSMCEGGCPSQCGDTGHGVCCDDDACGSSPKLCLDEDCQGASRPCTDEKCLAETTLDKNVTPSMTDGDKAAAAALASFGDSQALNIMAGGFLHGSSSLQPLDGNAASQTSFSLPQSLPCGSLSMQSMLGVNTNASPNFAQPPLEMALEFTLANHIMQYHDPLHGLAQTGSCVANDPSQLISRCTLPRFAHDGAPSDPYLAHFPSLECGFQVQDPTTFAQHILDEHRSALAMQNSQHPRAFGAADGRRFACAPLPKVQRPYFSPSPSPLGGLSVNASLSATPASLPTPLSLDPDTTLAPLACLPTPQTPVANSKTHLLAHQDQFLCRWLIHDDSICGLRFQNDEQLQNHCKFDHLKHLKKLGGGFRCGWANCTRDTCFTQRSKVERHMQVHTDKPVQCHVCGAALSAKQALDQHMRIHTGETPWVCKFPGCNCAFKQQSALTMHERTHTGDKPLECEICHKRFSESSNLSKHRRTHNVKGLHECQLCGKDFHRLDQLRRHMSTNHKDRPAEVDALLGKARTKVEMHRAFKLKKMRSRAQASEDAVPLNPEAFDLIDDDDQESEI